MRKCVSSIGSTQPIDSTRPYWPTRGFGITRSVGSAASLMRRRVEPSGSLRSDTVFTPSGVSSQVTSGITDIASTNCVPLKLPCRITTWNGSTRFS